MSTVTTVDVTTLLGSNDFPVNANDVYGLVETICVQNIRGVKSSNRIADAFYDYVVENGTVVEEAIIKMAEKQNFVKTGTPNLAPKDPTLAVKYFNNWEAKQFQTTVRRNDIRKIIADKGTGLDEVVSAILDTLNQGEGYDDYKAMRDIISNASVGISATQLFGDKHPKGIKGLIYAMREAYNALKATNFIGLDDQVSFEQATPVVTINADEQAYDTKSDIMTANGAVIIHYKDIETFSDTAKANLTSKGDLKRMEIAGNAKIRQKNNNLELYLQIHEELRYHKYHSISYPFLTNFDFLNR